MESFVKKRQNIQAKAWVASFVARGYITLLILSMMLVNFTMVATATGKIKGICDSAKWFFGLTDDHEFIYTVSDFRIWDSYVALGGQLKDES